MKISKIEFENFRNFKERCCVEFPTDGSVTVIYGPNGFGKTTLHQLFQWIIYGEVHFNKTAGKEMYNRDFEANLAVYQEFSVWGKIDFEHPDRDGKIQKYSLRREWVYRKDPKESKIIERKVRLSKEVGDHDWKTVIGDPATVIEQILPSGLSEYFFFDGESMISDLKATGKASAKTLRKALYSIFELDIYEQAKVHLGNQTNGNSTVLGKLYLSLGEDVSNSDLMKAKGDYRAALKRVEKLQEEIDAYKTAIEQHQTRVRELSEQIGSAPSRKALEDKRTRVKNDIKEAEKNIEKEMKAFGAKAVSMYPHLLISRVVEEAQYRIGLKVEDQQLPRGLSKELVDTLLKSETCLCGHPITEEERKVLEDLLKMFPPLSYKYIYDQFKTSAIRWATTYDPDALMEHINAIVAYKERIGGYHKEISDIDEELKQGGNVDHLIRERSKEEQLQREAQGYLLAAEREMGVKEKLQKQHKKKVDELVKELGANKEIRQKIDVMEAVKLYFETKLTSTAARFSRELCKAIQVLVDKMLSAPRSVTMTPNFELSVKDAFGNEAKSEGQFAVVSFAYIGGIFKLLSDVPELKGKEFPLILDGPFSKLDANHRQRVIDTIPSYAPQVILFSKDDINSCFGEQGSENVWTIYSNAACNISTVKRGYNPEIFESGTKQETRTEVLS